jgi:hypothetical protein
MVYILRVNRVDGSWGSLNWFQPGWDTWPAGYYASAHLDIDGNVDWGIHSTVVVVNARTDQNGVAQPFVLTPAPPGTLPTPDCPAGMYNTHIGDLYGEAGDMCALASPPSQQICPPGTHWDPATETCVADTIPLPPPIIFPPPPPPPPPPETGQPDPQGDEITYELCLQMAANANAIIYAINQLGQSQGSGGAANAACCANLVIAIGSVTNTLGLILKQLITMSAGAGAPLDLTQIVAELTSMSDSLDALATAPAMDLAPLTAAINDVARAIASAAPSDVAGIVQQLALQVGDEELSLEAIQYLNDGGFLSPDQVTFYSRGRLQ